MLSQKYVFRVRYPDTDQMGTVHHSEYAKYYEAARWELFRSIGISYKSFEEAGYLLPVTRMSLRFLKTIHYDDLITVDTNLKSIKGVRIWFTYKLYNENKELVNEGETELACLNKKNWKPCPIPDFLAEVIEMNRKN
ncbi:MAG: acyl-CoA thioesterase [Bacteroidales bacterium]|nr:acyl-CoA thioesterase [Bacteroidales bacterium]